MPRNGFVSNSSGKSQRQQDDFDALDDLCRQWGFEYVDFEARGRNDYGESVGMERAREALEANDWDNFGTEYCGDDEEEDVEGSEDAGVDPGVLGKVAREFEKEMFGLRCEGLGLGNDGEWSLGVDTDADGDDEIERKQVEQMEKVMYRMAMLSDLGVGDEDRIKRERRSLAAGILKEIMMEGEEVEKAENTSGK